MRLRVLSVVAAGLLLAPVVALAAPLTVAVALNPMALPLLVAQHEGMYGAEGLDVKVIECVSGARCMKTMLDGDADLATVADTPIIFRSFERNDFCIIGTFASAPTDSKLLVRKDSGIDRPSQLAGRRVGMAVGTSGQFFLDSMLMMHGVEPRQIQVVNIPPEDMPQALASGRVEALSVWEPYAWRTVKAMKSGVQVLKAAGIYTVTFNLVANRKLAGPRDADLAALLRAVQRAERFIHQQPQRAQRILMDRLSGNQAFVDWVWPGLEFRLGLDQSLIKTLESEARWALREGHASGKQIPNYLGFVHAAPLKSVQPEASNIAR
jgi:NitT/TauT family transport system substrate-binding protein